MAATLSFTLGFCTAQTQTNLNQTAGKSYQSADKQLNTTYQQVLKAYKNDAVFIRNFKVAQRLWVQLRDAELKAKYPDRHDGYYGSVLPMCKLIYLKQLTDERTKKLNIWLTGIPEGDVCAGSVKIKNN